MKPIPIYVAAWVLTAGLSSAGCGSSGGTPEDHGGDAGSFDTGTSGSDAPAAEDVREAAQSIGDAGPADAPQQVQDAGPPGTIGSGTISCMFADDGGYDASCGPGTACCNQNYERSNTCVTALSGCTGSPVGCTGPEDCSGQACCAVINGEQMIAETWCKPSCATAELSVCQGQADCPAGGLGCLAYGTIGTSLSVCAF